MRLITLLAATLALMTPLSVHANPTPIETALDATIVLYADDGSGRFLGSGFIFVDAVHAVTNAHVAGTAQTIQAVTHDGRKLVGTVVSADPVRDIALLAFDQPLGAPLVVSDEPAQIGEAVFALGAPLEEVFSVTQGMVSAIDRQVDPAVPMLMVQHDAAVNPGSSGGPLIDASGHLLGMNSQIADGSRLFAGIAFAIPAQDLARIADQMLTGTLRPVPHLGLSLRETDQRISAALGLDQSGLLVDEAEAYGIASEAGILAGDVLTRLDGQMLGRAGDLALSLDQVSDGLAEVTLLRQGREITLELDLEMIDRSLGEAIRPVKIARNDYSLRELGMTLDGAVIADLGQNSPAGFAGLSAGDEILAINGSSDGLADLADLVLTEPALFLVAREGRTINVLLDPWTGVDGPRPSGAANVLDPAVVLF